MEIAKLVQIEGMAGQDSVVLQRIGESVVDVAIRALSFDDVQLALDEQNQQQQVNLVGDKTVHRGAQMFINAGRTGVMLENRSEKPDKLVVVELGTHDIFRSFSLHQAHRDEIRLADQLHEFRGVLRAEVVFGYELHELPIRLSWQRPRHRGKTLEQRIGLPEQPLTIGVQPLRMAAVQRV